MKVEAVFTGPVADERVIPPATDRARRIAAAGPRSESEQRLHRALRASGLQFHYQHPFGPYVADFLFPEGLVVEVDGTQHETEVERARDSRRDRYFAEHGFETLRIRSWVAFKDTEGAFDKVRLALGRVVRRQEIDGMLSKVGRVAR